MAYKVAVQSSICYDFLACITRFSDNKGFTPAEKQNHEISSWYEASIELAPQNIKKLINLYFNPDTAFGKMLTIIVKDNNLDEIPPFIKAVERLPSDKMLNLFLASNIEKKKDLDQQQIKKVVNGDVNAIEYINEFTSFSDEDKWQVLQFIMNPDKMKEEITLLMKWFYDNLYKEIEDDIKQKLNQYSQDLTERISRYGDEYIKLLLPYEITQSEYKIMTLAVSYHIEKSRVLNIAEGIFIYGYRFFDSIEGEHSILSGKQLFKALADETRLNIIRLLSKRPWYGHEIAERLNISNSTVTHHMATLILNNIVSSYRQEYRIYFELNGEKLKEIVNSALESIIE